MGNDAYDSRSMGSQRTVNGSKHMRISLIYRFNESFR